MTVLRARSARGLSLTSYILETFAYAITLAYSARNNFPFSTYGENFFLTLQNILITLLIIHHSPSSTASQKLNSTPKLVAAVVVSLTTAYLLAIVPARALALLQLATIPLSLLSKFPQIYETHRARSTGQLSAVAVFSQIAGCLARLFTTATEVGDRIVFAGFLLALILNLVLGAQMYAFWGREVDDKVLGRYTVREKGQLEGIVVPPQSPLPSQAQSQPPQGGRRWARKVD
jgi:mannose-P-dolichol utilization defect protein 1